MCGKYSRCLSAGDGGVDVCGTGYGDGRVEEGLVGWVVEGEGLPRFGVDVLVDIVRNVFLCKTWTLRLRAGLESGGRV